MIKLFLVHTGSQQYLHTTERRDNLRSKLILATLATALLVFGANSVFAGTESPKSTELLYQQLNTQSPENSQPQGCYGPQCGGASFCAPATPSSEATNTNF